MKLAHSLSCKILQSTAAKLRENKILQTMSAKSLVDPISQTLSDQLRNEAGLDCALPLQIAQSETGQLPLTKIAQTPSGQSADGKKLKTLSAKSITDKKSQSVTGQFLIAQSVTGQSSRWLV